MKLLCMVSVTLASSACFANGELHPDARIHSEILGYDLQYRVYTPADIDDKSNLPVLYVTDGPGYISQGGMPALLDDLIESGKIQPIVVVFVDARDPDNPRINRRNSQFLCNRNYLSFYERELIPAIESAWPVGDDRDDRGILGISFGGTNAACFGLYGHKTFSNIGMQSPANHPVKNLLPDYEAAPRLPLAMYLSTGKPNDNTRANRKFRSILRDKGYALEYQEVREGHNWNNWRPLLDDVLTYFYSPPR